MKKLIAVILIGLMLCGCGTTKSTNLGISYWTDPETGVEYIIYLSGNGGGITPRLGR